MASPKAHITPELLEWGRKTAGFSEEVAAQKLRTKLERLQSWESGGDKPTIKQLRRIAQLYKRPVSVFYLSEKPAGFQVIRDLRRLPGTGLREYSPSLIYEMRLAQQRRELAIDLLEEIGDEAVGFDLRASVTENAEDAGQRIRKALHLTYVEQTKWRDPRIGFNTWRQRIESSGVLVFQMTRVPTDEVSGFALAEELFPVLVVNRKDVYSRRSFSLLHEFAHLILRVSGASDLDVDAARPPEDAQVEVFCNQVAAAALMPRERFLVEPIVAGGAGAADCTDDQIGELANQYSVSREAVVRRLLTFGRTTEPFYRAKRQQYEAERKARKDAEREKFKNKEFRTNPARDTVLDNGSPFVRLVLENYHQDRITLSDVSSYLGVKVKHLPRIEMAVGMG